MPGWNEREAADSLVLLAESVMDAVKVRSMADHRFKIGQTVFFRPRESRRGIAPLNYPYRVMQRLPEARGELQYQIRCTVTEQEFAASERELRPG